MYEYIAELERWKKFNKVYQEKYQKIKDFVRTCEEERKNSEDTWMLCKKPLVDIEKFNLNLAKRLTLEIYDLCTNKTKDFTDLNLKIEKTKICVDILFRENEALVKKEIISRMDDVLKFVSL